MVRAVPRAVPNVVGRELVALPAFLRAHSALTVQASDRVANTTPQCTQRGWPVKDWWRRSHAALCWPHRFAASHPCRLIRHAAGRRQRSPVDVRDSHVSRRCHPAIAAVNIESRSEFVVMRAKISGELCCETMQYDVPSYVWRNVIFPNRALKVGPSEGFSHRAVAAPGFGAPPILALEPCHHAISGDLGGCAPHRAGEPGQVTMGNVRSFSRTTVLTPPARLRAFRQRRRRCISRLLRRTDGREAAAPHECCGCRGRRG